MSEGTEVVESGSVDTGTQTAAPAVDTSSPAPSAAPGGVVSDPAAPAAFSPNFKFKVLDKEHEIPEFLRGAMKDAATEKQLKELHEKAFGLDVVKPKYQETKKQLDQVRGDYDRTNQEITRLGGMIRKNDLDSFFKALNISEDQVLRYALERVQYRELPLEQRMAVDQQAQERQRLASLETQSQTFEQRYYAEATANKGLQLDGSLAKPEVKSIVDAFDARVGTPGAFRAEVIKRGQLAFYATGQDISVEQAMKEVMVLAGGNVQPGGNPVAVPEASAGIPGATPAPAQPPIIPNVAGRGASPAKRAITSISDIRQRARELG